MRSQRSFSRLYYLFVLGDQATISEAERHLLDLILVGDADGWRQFVDRYQRRLIAFATRRVDQTATAQDLVQETFIAFLTSVKSYREQGTLESFLFRILRRRIADHYRKTGQPRMVPACEINEGAFASDLDTLRWDSMTASRHSCMEEQRDLDQRKLSQAIARLSDELRSAKEFRDLKIAEGLFYAGVSNQHLAKLLSITPNTIAVVKHRLIEKLSQYVDAEVPLEARKDSSFVETDLRSAWESHRPSCPKRSTLGKYSLGILPPAWEDFVRYHVEILGCLFCDANLQELRKGPSETGAVSRQHLFQSTIGFLPPSSKDQTD